MSTKVQYDGEGTSNFKQDLPTGVSMTTEHNWEEKMASEIVDNFLGIMDGWFQPDKYELLEKKAKEFLFEDALSKIHKAKEEGKTEMLNVIYQHFQYYNPTVRDFLQNLAKTYEVTLTPQGDNQIK